MDNYLNIKRLLERRKLEQADLAKVLGVTPKTAHNYLNGHTKITMDQIPAIVKLLRVDYDTLFTHKDLDTLDEPEIEYGINVDYKALCDEKDKTIRAKDDLISHLRGQIEYLKSKV